ncbi:3-hydroxybutyryl-CoA dehydrogenase [candidate division TA06 bacterium DG_24]|uniref:3-hydroxybutyryl-CoA dehydrogenase n=3 Tax=Bacteria division TA06 TaxID=1156500 RepID=A0A0S8JPM1_UNCT6|nr:MAG: 3-hydroxybutyryl-CoA dehydrogenase [candidate division TA06 bacterium DG_24]KPK71521.1 MAG: 3-hydroxybutyryl-CoA dehydrogenase [candidate division TA06 bacterium SM23_40]KPL11638.1 MAG: 3-hydroxybutyryl-CoA dehydrogenase [candidate division TA06 bacterium SM1_40]
MEISRVGIVGAGTMGSGIAQVCAASGIDVTLIDVSDEVLDRARKTMEKSLARLVKKEAITEQQSTEALRRVSTATSLSAVKETQFVIEAVIEDRDLKRKIFAELDGLAGKEVILATNTSSISITDIAAATGRADKVIGMHFMNPVPVMKLVEIIRGLATSDVTYQAVEALATRVGKTPVEVQDYPGFVSNRVLMPMINEAIYCLMEGVADREAIDTVMKLGMNHPMGPLALADLIGLDVCLHIMEVLYSGYSDSKYRPCPLLRKMVAAGRLGRKTASGFYDYSA